MSHFQLESAILEATRMDAPIQKGPLMRWQRKALESGVRSLSLEGLNTAPTGPLSCGSSKTPKLMLPHTPGLTPCSPGRLGKQKTPKQGKTPNKNGKTPSKSAPNTPSRGNDRFIPNRSAMDADLSHYALMSSENWDPTAEQAELSPTKAEYQRKMSEALNNGEVPQDSKILKFMQKPPEAKEGHMNNLKVLYSSGTGGTAQKSNSSRQIPQQPERILDAPELMDDYYLNLLDWSSNNHLAIALGLGVYIWNAASGSITQLLEMENPNEYVSSLAWIKEGNVLSVANSSGNIQLWDVGAQKLMRTMTGHATRVGSMCWNSYVLTSGCRSGAIHHSDVRVPEHHVGTLAAHTQEVCGLQWSPDGRFLASGANDNLVHVWDANLSHESRPLHCFNHHQAAVKAIAWCPWQNNLLATGGGTADRMIRLWNTNTGACLNTIDTKSQVCSILWNQRHKELISGHGFAQFQLTIWKYPSMTRVADLTGHTARVLSLSMSPCGEMVASAAADETLRLWKCFAVDHTRKSSVSSKSEKKSAAIPMSKGIR